MTDRDVNPQSYLLILARKRARKLGLPFSITAKDIPIPEFCPVLGIPLKFGTVKDHANSPSLDRFKPELGYVPGNVAVISYRANELKRNATLPELQKLVQWMVGLKASQDVRPFILVPEGKKRPRFSGRIYKPKNTRFWYIQFYSRGKQVRESTRSEDYGFAQEILRSRIGLTSLKAAA